jgi:hypothetical protein
MLNGTRRPTIDEIARANLAKQQDLLSMMPGPLSVPPTPPTRPLKFFGRPPKERPGPGFIPFTGAGSIAEILQPFKSLFPSPVQGIIDIVKTQQGEKQAREQGGGFGGVTGDRKVSVPPTGPVGPTFDERAGLPGQTPRAIAMSLPGRGGTGLTDEQVSLYNQLRKDDPTRAPSKIFEQVFGEAPGLPTDTGTGASGAGSDLLPMPTINEIETHEAEMARLAAAQKDDPKGVAGRVAALQAATPTGPKPEPSLGMFSDTEIANYFTEARAGSFGQNSEATMRFRIQQVFNQHIDSALERLGDDADSAEIDAAIATAQLRVQPLSDMLTRLVALNQNAVFMPLFKSLFPDLDVEGLAGSGVPLLSILGTIASLSLGRQSAEQAAQRPPTLAPIVRSL